MSLKLKDRIDVYQTSTDNKLLPRLPLVIVINGRSFSKLTGLLDKPYCDKFSECIFSTMLRLCTDVEGAIFAYQYNDEIVLITRNDQNPDTIPWYNNSIQKICSITSSIATLHFNRCAEAIELNLMNEPIFASQVFAVPNVAEAINTLIYKQQHNFHTSIQFACFYELLKNYDKNTIINKLQGLNIKEKINLLEQECNIDFTDYPDVFRRGGACYKVNKEINGIVKEKWHLSNNIPIFTEDQSFLTNIFKFGVNIYEN